MEAMEIHNIGEVPNVAKKCAEEVEEILKKYRCRIIIEQRDYYGQPVFVPVFVEVKTKPVI